MSAAAAAIAMLLMVGGASANLFTGDGTAYSESVADGKGFACSFRYLPEAFRRNFAAINPTHWEDGKACGKCVSVKCVDPQCTVQNKPVVMQIVDLCPECKEGDIDMSIPVYRDVTGIWPNRLKVSWEFCDCGGMINGTIKITPKDGFNPNWSAYYISNAKFPLKSVSVNGNQLTRATYNFWVLSGPLGQAPYTVVLEATNGQKVTAVTDKMLADQDLGVQFQDGGAPVQSAG